jgi:hypothetical protein
MALPGLVAAKNLADVADRERTWDNLGLNVGVDFYSGLVLDDDARSYLNRVTLTEGGVLEDSVAVAVNQFVLGCKADDIWNAIKASCILAGARTLTGALVPLVGTAPSRTGTEGGWNYARKTGLKANGTDNDIDTGRNNNADPQDNKHLAVWISTHHTRNQTRADLGGASSNIGGSQLMTTTSARFYRVNWIGSAANSENETATTVGFWGASRTGTSTVTGRYANSNRAFTDGSAAPINVNMRVFSRGTDFSDARLAFYSIGESLDLALLDARVTTLINAFAAAIP